MRRAAAVVVVALTATGCSDRGTEPLDVELGFASAAEFATLEFTDAEAWRWNGDVDGGALELIGPSDYAPPHRSPLSIALLPFLVGDFVLEVECLQTGREYGHRDLCLFFGYVDPAQFHYVHLAPAPDPHAHNLFVVDDAPRAALLPVAEEGIDWGDGAWHTLRLERRGDRVTVRFDGVTVMEGTSETFRRGRVGVGSFDDSGRFRRIRLRELAPLSDPR